MIKETATIFLDDFRDDASFAHNGRNLARCLRRCTFPRGCVARLVDEKRCDDLSDQPTVQ